VTADRLPAILQAMQDDTHAAEDVVLAAGLAACIDLHALASLLPVNATDIALARGLGNLITDGNDGAPLADADRALACRVAARMASTAALLLAVDPEDHLSTAEVMWSASGKLLGLYAATRKAMRAVEHATPMTDYDRERLAVHTEVAAAMMKQHHGLQAVASAEGVTVTLAGDRESTTPTVQVGDILDAAKVPHRTLVECTNCDLVIRLPTGKGWTLEGPESLVNGWPWERGASVLPVRIMATDIPADECWRVARMTPAEAREWLADRGRRQPV
jgi:nucleotide-binding universal stress UspA family protein